MADAAPVEADGGQAALSEPGPQIGEEQVARRPGAPEPHVAVNSAGAGHQDDHALRLDVMRKSIDALGNPCSELIVLFYFQKLSLSRMKEKLGYKSEESIKSQKFKCMERLRKIYFQHYRKSS